mgnify:CR=1 FL=1
MTKILIIGSSGQLGTELQSTAPTSTDFNLSFFNRNELDITTASGIALISSLKPSIVINASAYTKVDLAESEQALAFASNHTGVEQLAKACAAINCRLIHISTDFVFDGNNSKPYEPLDKTNPLSIYGESKLKGEQAITNTPNLSHVIIRTSWVYSAAGQNFVKTMLKLFTQRPDLNVVYDQIGSPTWAKDLAQVIWAFVDKNELTGCYHYTNAGVASWYDFATAIQEEANALGLIDSHCSISAIPSSAYPTPAKRPHFSVLNCQSLEHDLQITRPHWRQSLRNMLKELSHDT